MKIEAGKYYKTRGGNKAHVLYIGVSPLAENRYFPVVAHIKNCGLGTFTDDGHSLLSAQSDWDLVAEWSDREPVKVSGWVNVYPTYHGYLHSRRKEADEQARPDRTACVYVSGEEGKEP